MKRAVLLRYLHEQGCLLIREGRRHSVFIHQKTERTSTIPRHNEINDFLAEKICKDLGIISLRKKK
ncbi:MAG: type II toxin-antitoxin system HicA family toxin [Patescibacteria group bacterium]